MRPPGSKEVRALDLFILRHLWIALLVLCFNVQYLHVLKVTQLNYKPFPDQTK